MGNPQQWNNSHRQKPIGIRASYATHVQSQVWSEQVWLNTTFISRGSWSWDKLAVETYRAKTILIIITILHIIITTISILNLRSKQLRQKYWCILKCKNKYWKYTQIKRIHKFFALFRKSGGFGKYWHFYKKHVYIKKRSKCGWYSTVNLAKRNERSYCQKSK